MNTLHTINKSPFEKPSLDSCLRTARDGASVLLFEDGVYAVMRGTVFEGVIKAAGKRLKLFALEADLKARGLAEESVVEGVKIVDYGGFVDLTVANDQVQAWL